MEKIVISRDTRLKLLTAAASGQRVEPWMFQFTRRDGDFQAELVRTAEAAKNTAFFEGLREFIAEQQREYWRLYGIAAREQSQKHKTARQEKKEARRQSGATFKRKRRAQANDRRQHRKERVSPPLKITPSPNWNPTGVSFDEFLKQRGFSFSPNYRPPFIHFVSGGAVDSNRRRH